jgi:hypothetical protein
VTDLFLVFLGCAWVVCLGPAVLRARNSTPLFSARKFQGELRTIGSGSTRQGRIVLAPRSSATADRSARRAHARAQRRRRRLLVALMASIPATIAVALLEGLWWWVGPVGAVVALALYVVLLVRARRRREESMRKVSSLARRRARTPDSIAERA